MSEVQWSLRAGAGSARVLMRHLGNPDSCWVDVGSFPSYNDAEWVLRILQKAAVEREIADGIIEDLRTELSMANAWIDEHAPLNGRESVAAPLENTP